MWQWIWFRHSLIRWTQLQGAGSFCKNESPARSGQGTHFHLAGPQVGLIGQWSPALSTVGSISPLSKWKVICAYKRYEFEGSARRHRPEAWRHLWSHPGSGATLRQVQVNTSCLIRAEERRRGQSEEVRTALSCVHQSQRLLECWRAKAERHAHMYVVTQLTEPPQSWFHFQSSHQPYKAGVHKCLLRCLHTSTCMLKLGKGWRLYNEQVIEYIFLPNWPIP